MKKLLACVLIFILCFTAPIPSVSAAKENQKYFYNDFESGLSAEPLPTGNGDNTAYVLYADGADCACENGELHIELTNGNYLCMQNSMTGMEDYRQLVVRIKGTNSLGDNLTGNSLCFWFGSYSTPGEKLYLHAVQLTPEYSDVVIKIPDGYFDNISDEYKASLFITTERGAVFDVYIEEIYFSGKRQQASGAFADVNSDGNADIRDLISLKKQFSSGNLPLSSDVDRNGCCDSADLVFMRKFLLGEYTEENAGRLYSDFSEELIQGEYVNSGESNGKIQLFYSELCEYSTENGFFNVNLSDSDGYVRFLNTLTLTENSQTSRFKYMIITLKGGAFDSEGNIIESGDILKLWFGAWSSEANCFYISADELERNLYKKIVIPLEDSFFYEIPDDYTSGLFIKNVSSGNTYISIDEIRFCFSAPSDAGIIRGSAKVYDFSDELPENDYCSVFVNGSPCYVYETNVNSRRVSPSGNASDELEIGRCGVVSFDMAGNVTIEIVLKDGGQLESAAVTPMSEGIEVSISNKLISFTISECGQYTVEFNGSSENALHIFANPFEKEPIYASSESIIYFGPGVYDVGQITLNKGQTLYLAGGAVVYGYVVSDEDDIQIRGRGYLDGSVYPRYVSDGFTSAHKTPVNLSYCKNIYIEGIACLDPSGWAYNLFNCSDVTIDNVKVITSRQNGDGISVQSCSNVEVRRSFFRTWDDSLVVKNYEGLSTYNVSFSDCVIWTDLAQSMEIGYETCGDSMTGISFSNITVLHNFHKAVISIHNSDRAAISDVIFSDITVEDAGMGSGDGSNYLIDFQVLYSPIWSTESIRGTIQNITVENVSVLNGVRPQIRITGYDAQHGISGVTLSGINILGENIDSLSSGYFIINSFVSELTVLP